MRRLALALALAAACGGDDDGGSGSGADGGGGGDGGGGSDAWEQLADLPSGPVQETAVVEVDGLVYVLGGIDGNQATVDSVLIYDPSDDSWDRGPALPATAHHINAGAVDGTIYVVGSLEPDFTPRAAVWAWTPGDAEWTTDLTPMPAPARGAAAVGVVGGSIVVAGGFSAAGSSAVVSVYDPGTDQWDDESSDPLPMPIDHGTAQVVDGSMYVIGGRSNGIIAVTAEVWRHDDGAWTARAAMPTARGGTASGVVNGRIVVVGGEGNGDAATGVFPQAELYDPAADQWSALDDMPTPRHGMGAAGLGGDLYVPGGADTDGFDAVATHEVLHVGE
jgi:N-acetylneuraminic acid mutarotase